MQKTGKYSAAVRRILKIRTLKSNPPLQTVENSKYIIQYIVRKNFKKQFLTTSGKRISFEAHSLFIISEAINFSLDVYRKEKYSGMFLLTKKMFQ